MFKCLNLTPFFAHNRSGSTFLVIAMPYRLLAASELAEFLRALSHPRRIQIIEELRSGERHVASLAKATGLVHSSVSQHLMVLRKSRCC